MNIIRTSCEMLTYILVFGRKTYQLMVPFWPDVAKNHSKTKATNEFAQTFDSIHKILFPQSLDRAEGKNTRIVRTKLQDEILKFVVHPAETRLPNSV
jgi:hypothetical protein